MKLESATTALGDLAEVRQLEFEMISGDGVNYVLSASITGRVLQEHDLDKILTVAKKAGAQVWIENGRAVLR